MTTTVCSLLLFPCVFISILQPTLTTPTALDRCLELMAEDPERQRRRQYLLKEKEKISKAQEWLATARKSEDEVDTAGGSGGGFDAFIKPQPDDD